MTHDDRSPMIKPPCGHTKYEGSAPCICSQFETYWREQIAKEQLSYAVQTYGWDEISTHYETCWKKHVACFATLMLAIARGQK